MAAIPANSSPSGELLRAVVLTVLERDASLSSRSAAIELRTDMQTCINLPAPALETVIGDVFHLAFGSPRVRRVSVYAGQLPGCERITIVAEYGAEAARPRLILLGRIGDGCVQLPSPHWPSRCSATWFDNGYEHIYRVSIQRA